MRQEIKIVRNGNASGVNLPRAMIARLGWLPGQRVVCELLEDNSIRLWFRRDEDYVPSLRGRVVYDEHGTVTK